MSTSSSSSDRNPFEELAAEFLDRKRRGERPTLEEFCRCHPDLADEIRELFPILLRVEDLAGESSGAATGGLPPCTGAHLERLGDFRILREVGRGGMGVVYEAEQESLGRRVALKVLPDAALADRKHVLRFQREARAAARLHHTNIVPVFGVGRDDGHHYYVMQFIPGMGLDVVLAELRRLRRGMTGNLPPASRTVSHGPVSAAAVAQAILTGQFSLTEPEDGMPRPAHTVAATATGDPVQDAPRDKPPPPGSLTGSSTDLLVHSDADRPFFRSVARIGLQVAEALEYANRQGVLHRDVKPSNLLLDPQGNVWVADFGLAKATDTEDLTHSGDLVGTVRYMAPERFQGKCDARSDVYALGLTLYELLALRPAYDTADRQALIRRVMSEPPERLRKFEPHLPRDLETIVEKAIAHEPAERYASAAALAEDLRQFLDDKPIKARRVGAAERLAKWARRRPAIAALASALLVAMVCLLGLGVWSYARINRALAESQTALEAKTKALGAERKALGAAVEGEYKALLNETIGKIEAKPENWQEDSLKNLKRLAGFDTAARDLVRLRSLAVTVLMDFGVKEVRRLRGHSGRVWSIDISPDGRTMATLDHGGHLRLWEFPSGRLLKDIRDRDAQKLPPYHRDTPRPIVRFDPLGRYLAYTTWNRSVEFFPLAGHKAPAIKPKSGVPPRALSFDRAGKTLVVGWADGRIDLLDAATGATKSSRRTTAKLGGLDRREDKTPDLDDLYPCGPISPDGRRLPEWSLIATREHLRGLRIVGLAEDESSSPVDADFVPLTPACFRFDGAVLATGGEEQVALWDVRTGKQTAVLHHPDGYSESPADVAFSPRGDLLAEVGNRGTLRLWDPGSEKSLLRLRTGLVELHSLAWSPDGLYFAVGGSEAVVLYQLTGRGARRFVAQASRGWVLALAPHPSQALVASGNDHGQIELVDARSERIVNSWVTLPSSTPGPQTVWSIAFDPSGSLIATGGHVGGGPAIWDARTGQLRCRIRGGTGLVVSLDWDPAGRRIAWSTDNGDVFIDDVATGTRVRAWPWGQGEHFLGPYVAFLEGGRAVIVGDGNGLIEVRDVATGLRIRQAVVEFGVLQMTVSPDRRLLVASHGDGRFTVLSLPELTRLYASGRIHDHPPSLLAFSADGRWLVTGAYGNAAVLWATDSWQPVLSLSEAVASFAGSGWLNPIAFLADGPRLIVAQRAKGVDGWSIWDLSQIWPKLDELGLGWEVSEASRTRPSRPVGRTTAVTERTLMPAHYDPKLCLDFVRLCLELEPNQAQACTDMAWFLATMADPKLRDPPQALRWAQNAVRLAPDSPLCWNTLGAVHCRLGQYQEAIGALQKSIHLNGEVPTAHDALFLAMSHQRLGRPDQARTWFDRALQARQEFTSNDPRQIEELDRIQGEAEAMLARETRP
jgi:WD40 repeat protein